MSVFTGGLLTAGALVTSNDAGLSIPDWPLAYGSLVPPLVGGIRYEWGHRVVAGTVALLTALLAAWLWRSESRAKIAHPWADCAGNGGGAGSARRHDGDFSPASCGFRCPRVPGANFLLHYRKHGTFHEPLVGAQTISKWLKIQARRKCALWHSLTVGATFLQLLLGAVFRHKGSGILPHLIGAAVVTAMIFLTAGAMRNRFPSSAPLTRCRRSLHCVIGFQLILGGAAWWSRITTR